MSQRAREAIYAAIRPNFATDIGCSDVVNRIIPLITRLEDEALERGARAMQEAAAENLKKLHGYPTQTYEPGYIDVSAILGLSPADVTKGLTDADT